MDLVDLFYPILCGPQPVQHSASDRRSNKKKSTRILCLMTTMVLRLLALVASVNAFASRPIDEKIALLIIDTQECPPAPALRRRHTLLIFSSHPARTRPPLSLPPKTCGRRCPS